MPQSRRLLSDLCSISSASGDVEGLYKVADRLAAELTALGMMAQIHAEPGINGRALPVLVAGDASDDEPATLLIGHLDTVLPATAPRLDDGRLFGTGALDMKGGFAALVGALRELRREGRRRRRI